MLHALLSLLTGSYTTAHDLCMVENALPAMCNPLAHWPAAEACMTSSLDTNLPLVEQHTGCHRDKHS